MKNLKLYFPFSIGFVLSILLSCSNSDEQNIPAEEPEVERQEVSMVLSARSFELTELDQEIADANSIFAWNLFQKGCELLSEDNLVLSPLSASIALSMLVNGAESDTQSQIINALGYTGYDIEDINNLNAKLAYNLPHLDDETIVTLANSLWYALYITLSEDYLNNICQFYEGEVRYIDEDTFLEDINGWIYEKTSGLIENYYDSTPPACLLLANALYYKSKWRDEIFNTEATKEGEFTNKDGSVSTVEFMNGYACYPFYDNDLLTMLPLPMGSNGQYTLNFVLPKDGVGMEECITYLRDNIIELNEENDVTIKIPKFESSFKDSLTEVLKALGMESMFGGNCDLSNISPTNLSVSNVGHAVRFKIDEQGAEGAAVTTVEITTSSGPVEDSQELSFICDRPFLYYLTEKTTGTILFVGCINAF